MIVRPHFICICHIFFQKGCYECPEYLYTYFVTLFALWGIRVPLSYWLSTLFGEIGIWWGIPAGWLFGMTFSTAYYLLGRWKMKIIVRKRIQEIEE
jgi:hypothetical protein